MTVTENSTEANPPLSTAPSPRSTWAHEYQDDSCHFSPVVWENGRLIRRWLPCRTLTCPNCGPRKLQADYEDATKRFGHEKGPIYVVYVHADDVDKINKRAARRDAPTLTVPIGEKRNAVFSTYDMSGGYERMEPGHIASDEEIRGVFLQHRIPKRQIRPHGRWKTPPKPKKDVVVLSRNGISQESFVKVARELGRDVHHSSWIDDGTGLRNEEWWFALSRDEIDLARKRLLAAEDDRRRRLVIEKRQRRGGGWSVDAYVAA